MTWKSGILFIVLLVLLVCVRYVTRKEKAILFINDRPLYVEIVRTDAARERGLSGRDHLASDQGMLFIFDEPSIRQFWMKDMRFPLDLVWLRQGRVVDVVSLSPPRTIQEIPEAHTSIEPVDRVLELNLGEANNRGIVVGSFLGTP
ncbi:MAG: DUF192 domain-containing protein [Patescibacteria group bacterium]